LIHSIFINRGRRTPQYRQPAPGTPNTYTKYQHVRVYIPIDSVLLHTTAIPVGPGATSVLLGWVPAIPFPSPQNQNRFDGKDGADGICVWVHQPAFIGASAADAPHPFFPSPTGRRAWGEGRFASAKLPSKLCDGMAENTKNDKTNPFLGKHMRAMPIQRNFVVFGAQNDVKALSILHFLCAVPVFEFPHAEAWGTRS
jgi:hypothetical protein